MREQGIIVCSACLRASCLLGVSYCEDYKRAGTVRKSLDELLALGPREPGLLEGLVNRRSGRHGQAAREG